MENNLSLCFSLVNKFLFYAGFLIISYFSVKMVIPTTKIPDVTTTVATIAAARAERAAATTASTVDTTITTVATTVVRSSTSTSVVNGRQLIKGCEDLFQKQKRYIPYDYKMDGGKWYGYFGDDGIFECHKIYNVRLPNIKACGTGVDEIYKGVLRDESLPNLDECLKIVEFAMANLTNNPTTMYSMVYAIKYFSLGLCYTADGESIDEIPVKIECPEEYRAKIINRNFVFRSKGENYGFRHPPAWSQYRELLRNYHPSVSTDDYDYDHKNDYS